MRINRPSSLHTGRIMVFSESAWGGRLAVRMVTGSELGNCQGDAYLLFGLDDGGASCHAGRITVSTDITTAERRPTLEAIGE